MGELGVSVIYKSMDPEAASLLTGIFDPCIAGDASSCYSFAGLHMADDRGMALAALEICANDSTVNSCFDCMYKLATAHQTGRSGPRNFVLAYRWYSALIADRGPAALVDVAQSNLNGASADKVMAWAPTGRPGGTPRCRSRNALVDVKKRPHADHASD